MLTRSCTNFTEILAHIHVERAKTSCLGIRIICLERYVYLRTVVSVRYHYKDPIKHVDLVQSGHHYHFTEVTCSPHDTAEIVLIILAHIHVGDCPIRTVIHLITYSFLLAILAACRGFSYAQLRCDVAVRFVDGETCLSTDCCFSEISLQRSN
jgi:hypothetical protein